MPKNELSNLLTRRWVCNVARAGHVNSACSPDEPHPGSGCGYRNELSLTDEQLDALRED